MVRMDETNGSNSSSAAAVANGASAAAHTKTVGVSPIKSASHVKLLIKSSNQQYEDHVIESDLMWTVNRLKSHLSVVYPSKPPVSDQKLIYSGQLLSDNVQLKDVIRSYKDVYTQNHIIHLVYTPKNLPPATASTVNRTKAPLKLNSSQETNAISGSEGSAIRMSNNNMSSTDGLRHRQTTAGSNFTNEQPTRDNVQQQQSLFNFNQQMYPYFMNPQLIPAAGIPCPQFSQNFANSFSGPYNVQTMITQHTAMYNWMQQVYSQYMEQCLRLSGGGSADATAAYSSYPSVFPTFPQMFLQQFPTSIMTPISESIASASAATANAATDGAEVERQDQQQQPAVVQVAAARFPNLPQDEQDNRDWLDNFFSITRFALFLTLLYINASPLRCLIVVIIAGGIYLYHIGLFRIRNERNNNNLNRNNNAAQNAAVDQIRQGVDQQQNAAAAPERQGNNDNNIESEHQIETTTDTPENVNNESMFSTIRTFVVTFFTSLLPETQGL